MIQHIQKHEYLKKAAELAIKQSTDLDLIAEDVLTNVVIDTIRKYQQKLNVGIQDSVSDLLDGFKTSITEKITAIASNWRVANRDYILFPRGCRFCYSKADNTIVIVEQEPQIRSLLFDTSILGERLSHSIVSERLAIALPYVVFILHFKKNHFCNMYCGWKNSPIKDLSDNIYHPILPNIHDNFSVCTGVLPNNYGENITQKCDFIISHFWNSKFNNDLSKNWWKKSYLDYRLKSARTWSEESLKDPMFILQINPTEQKSPKYFIKLITMHDFELDETSLKHTLSDSIDSCVESLFIKILRYFRNTKFDRYHPKDIKDILKKVLSQANTELSDLIFIIKTELQKLDKEITKIKSDKLVEPKSNLWCDYKED